MTMITDELGTLVPIRVTFPCIVMTLSIDAVNHIFYKPTNLLTFLNLISYPVLVPLTL